MHAATHTVETLCQLIAVCEGDAHGFLAHAGLAATASLKSLLQTRSRACRIAASHLQLHVVDLADAFPRCGISTAGTHAEGPAGHGPGPPLSLPGAGDLQLLLACERREQAALQTYAQAALRGLPPEVAGLVAQQCDGVRRSLLQWHVLRAALQAAAPPPP